MTGPSFLLVEPTNICNLGCVLCPTGNGKQRRKHGMMAPAHLERILKDPIVNRPSVLLWGWGEPTLHPDLPNLAGIALRQGCFVEVQSNGHGDIAVYELLQDVGISRITIALDDLDEERLQMLRGPDARLDRIMQLIKHLAARQSKSELVVQCLMTRLNQEILPSMRSWVEILGAKMIFKTLNVGAATKNIADRLIPTLPGLGRNPPEENGACSFLNSGGTMLCDGSFVPCCYDWEGRYILGRPTDGWETIHRNRACFTKRVVNHGIEMCNHCTRDDSMSQDQSLLGQCE